MSRFDQRKQKRLQNPEFRAAYVAADAELKLVDALDEVRRGLGLTQAELADRLGKTQPAVSQFFAAESGISLERVVEYLIALKLQVRVNIEPAGDDDETFLVHSHVAGKSAKPVPAPAHIIQPEKIRISAGPLFDRQRRQAIDVETADGRIRARKRHLVAVA